MTIPNQSGDSAQTISDEALYTVSKNLMDIEALFIGIEDLSGIEMTDPAVKDEVIKSIAARGRQLKEEASEALPNKGDLP